MFKKLLALTVLSIGFNMMASDSEKPALSAAKIADLQAQQAAFAKKFAAENPTFVAPSTAEHYEAMMWRVSGFNRIQAIKELHDRHNAQHGQKK